MHATIRCTQIAVAHQVSSIPSCGESTGSYEIRLLESGNIRVEVLEDECRHRVGSVAREYEPVR